MVLLVAIGMIGILVFMAPALALYGALAFVLWRVVRYRQSPAWFLPFAGVFVWWLVTWAEPAWISAQPESMLRHLPLPDDPPGHLLITGNRWNHFDPKAISELTPIHSVIEDTTEKCDPLELEQPRVRALSDLLTGRHESRIVELPPRYFWMPVINCASFAVEKNDNLLNMELYIVENGNRTLLASFQRPARRTPSFPPVLTLSGWLMSNEQTMSERRDVISSFWRFVFEDQTTSK